MRDGASSPSVSPSLSSPRRRHLSGAYRGLDIGMPSARPCWAVHLRHHRCDAGHPSTRAPLAGPRFGRPCPSTRCSRLLPSALRLAPAETRAFAHPHASFASELDAICQWSAHLPRSYFWTVLIAQHTISPVIVQSSLLFILTISVCMSLVKFSRKIE